MSGFRASVFNSGGGGDGSSPRVRAFQEPRPYTGRRPSAPPPEREDDELPPSERPSRSLTADK